MQFVWITLYHSTKYLSTWNRSAHILFSIDKVVPLLLRSYSIFRCIGATFETRGYLKKAKLFSEMHEYFAEEMLEGWYRGGDYYCEDEESILHILCVNEFLG